MTYSTEDLERMENMFSVRPKSEYSMENDSSLFILESMTVYNLDQTRAEDYTKIAIPKRMPEFEGVTENSSMCNIIEKSKEAGWIVPSLPLYFNILGRLKGIELKARKDGDDATKAELASMREDPEALYTPKKMLQCSTQVNFTSNEIIHYSGFPWTYTESFDPVGVGTSVINEDLVFTSQNFYHKLTNKTVKATEKLSKHHGLDDLIMIFDRPTSASDPSTLQGPYSPTLSSDCNQHFLHFHNNLDEMKSQTKHFGPYRIPLFKVLE